MGTVNVQVKDRIVDVTPVINTDAYATGDVLSITTELVELSQNTVAYPFSLVVFDKDPTRFASIEIWILRSSTSIGAINAAEALADGNMEEVLTIIPIASGSAEWSTTANFAYVQKNLADTGMGALLKPSSGGKLYYATKYTDAGDTFAVGDLKVKLGLGNVTSSS